MDSVYGTPVSITSKKTTRRRAMSPSQSNESKSGYSSPYQVIDLENLCAQGALKDKLLEAESIISDLREERNKMRDELLNRSGLNESIIIETSNRVSTQETRIFKRDLTVLEEELRQKQQQIRTLQDKIAHLERDNQKLLEDLKTSDRKREDYEENNLSLRSQISELEDRLLLKETHLSEIKADIVMKTREFNEKIVELETKAEGLSRKLMNATTRLEIEIDEKQRQNERVEHLKKEISRMEESLKAEIAISKASGDELTSQMRKSLDTENQTEETNRKVLCEVQQLNQKIEYLTPIRKRDESKDRDQFLQMSAKIIEENINDLKKRNSRLEKELKEKKDMLDGTRNELEKLKKSMTEAIGNSDQANKFLSDENAKLTLQKANIRCELLNTKRELSEFESKMKNLEKLRDEALEEVKRLKEEKCQTEEELRKLQDLLAKNKDNVEELQLKVAGMECLRRQNEEMKTDISKMQERLAELAKHLVMADKQCSHYKSLKETAEGSRGRAIQQCNEMVMKIRNLEASLENQRKVEQELQMLKSDNERQIKKIEYLNEEIQETHKDYREELSRMVMEKGKQDENVEILNQLKLKVSQRESEIRSLKKLVEELKRDNQKIGEQCGDVRNQQTTIVEENINLRKALADAVAKIEKYKRDYENSKELGERLAEELGKKEKELNTMEEELNEKSQQVVESEQVVNYLHSQINVKPTKMPKLGRRSTLLNTVSESQLDTSAYNREAEEIRKLESEKMELLRSLEQKKRMVEKQKVAENSIAHTTTVSNVFSKSASEIPSRTTPGTMRHDIPHKWKEVRHLSVLSLKCAICFVGIPTFGKAKKCSHCDVQVHAACASRVYNTCGMPTQCANFYRETHTTVSSTAISEGRMNGWLRIYRDDHPSSQWISSWAMMDISKISFYTNDGADLDKPFFSIDLNREQWVMRAGMEMPVECDDQMRASNVLMIKMPRRNLYLLAPSQNSARRWSDCLQVAQRKRMMLTSKPSSLAEYSCLLVLNSPNNLKIYKAHAIDDWILFATQTGLFFTSISQPRNPMRIAGPSSVTALEVIPEINCVSLVANSNGELNLVPLDSLQLAMQSMQPSIRPDPLKEYLHVGIIKYHKQNGQVFLIVADSTHIHIRKYNSSRDVFSNFAKIEVSEPVICIESGSQGFYFGSDTFYHVSMDSGGNVNLQQLVPPKEGDYPVNVIVLGESELLLAYQNYGIFVDKRGSKSRKETVEWEQMPMEFLYTNPYLYVIHYDSIEILEVTEYMGLESGTFLEEREVFECVNAHIIGKQMEAVLISVSSRDTTEVHRFNTNFGVRKNVTKRRGVSPFSTLKRTKNY